MTFPATDVWSARRCHIREPFSEQVRGHCRPVSNIGFVAA